MAASIRMRPAVLKSFYISRTSCIVCRECQSVACTTNVANSEGGGTSGMMKPPKHGEEIKIPRKKKRDSLSILKALASTVGKDPTAARYVFMDDPALVPPTFMAEKILLSKASGKRTARFMVNEYRNAFDHDAAVPPVKAFQPFNTEYEHHDVSVDALKERISHREVTDAIEVYKRLEEEGKDVSSEVKLSFLELLCVFGCKDAPQKLMPEEKLVNKFTSEDDEKKCLKIRMDLAEEVFHSLPEKSTDVYNWLARGMAKINLSKGCKYYKEMKSSEIPVYVGTYNQLINFLPQQNVDRMQEVQNYLTAMKSEGIAPNLETFHSVLRALRYTSKTNYAKDIPSVLAEMKVLNIEPTLYTWTLVISALDNLDVKRPIKGNDVIPDIVEIVLYMRKRGVDKYQIDHPKGNFFKEAMHLCRRNHDADVALMLYKFREDMGYNYITTSLRDDQIFYENLFILVCNSETAEKMMEIYNCDIPYQKTLNPVCIKLMLENIDTFGAFEYIPQIWQDMQNIITSPYCREGVLIQFMELLESPKVRPELGKDFVHIAKQMFKDCKESTDWNPLSFGIIADQVTKVFVNNMELELAWESAMYIYQKKIPGFIDGETLARVFEMSLMENDGTKIMSFCELPVEARDTMTARVNELLSQYRDNVEACLNSSQIQELENAFLEVKVLS